MDRNENQNSYRNTRRKRGNTKAHEGLKRRVNVLMVLVILLIAAIAAILFFGKKNADDIKTLKEDVEELQKNYEQLSDEEPEESVTPDIEISETPTPTPTETPTPTPIETPVAETADNSTTTSADAVSAEPDIDITATGALTEIVKSNENYLEEFLYSDDSVQEGENIFPISADDLDGNNEYSEYNDTRKLAIEILQKNKGLEKIDGILGEDTLKAIGLNPDITTEISIENYNNNITYQDVINYAKDKGLIVPDEMAFGN